MYTKACYWMAVIENAAHHSLSKFSECTFWVDTMLFMSQGTWGSPGKVHPFFRKKTSLQNGLCNHRRRCLFKQNENR